MRRFGLAAGAAMALALSATAQEAPLTVSAITVNVDITAIANVEAAPFWRDLPDDLETAIAAEMVGSLDREGKELFVDVREITLADEFTAAFGPDDARIAGRVEVIDPDSERVEAAYDIAATATQAAGFLATEADIITISPTSQTFYDAVVAAFARGVAETVRGGP